MNYLFGIGLPRTGTTSLAKALRILGFKGENYCLLSNQQRKDEQSFFKINNSYYKSYKELLEDNKKSKFILTIRDSDSWRESVRKVLKGKYRMSFEFEHYLPNVHNYTQEVLQHFSRQGALNQLLVVDLFDQSCDCSCKWKNLYEFLGVIPHKKLGAFPHIISWWT